MSNLQEFINDDLDISQEMYDRADAIYKEVSDLLEEELADYAPHIFPQGSFRLKTVIKPLKGDEYDVDLVCCLNLNEDIKKPSELRELVGNALEKKYSSKLTPGKRCWKLDYENFHVDILPAIPERTESAKSTYEELENPSFKESPIRIPEKGIEKYHSSNPIGYDLWFKEQQIRQPLQNVDTKAQEPLPEQKGRKTVLQEVVKILKHHRDFMFRDDKENKPISIIITTLAAQNYNGEQDILTALKNIVSKMPDIIKTNYIQNPVNPRENFADKWKEEPKKKDAMNRWLKNITEMADKLTDIKAQGGDRLAYNNVMLDHLGITVRVEQKNMAINTGAIPISPPKPWCSKNA